MSLAIGAKVPDFTLRGVDGGEHSLADYDASKLLVLIQSCNHCPYVLAWEGRMAAIQRDYADRGVSVVAFNSNDASRYPEDSYERMVAHASEQSFPFAYLHDGAQDLHRALGSERTPEVFLFDEGRRLVYHGAIDDSGDDSAVGTHYLRDALDAALAGQDPPLSDTAPVGCSVKRLP